MTQALACFSARRPWLMVGLWFTAAAAGVLLSLSLLSGSLDTRGDVTGQPEFKRAEALLRERLRAPAAATEVVVVRSPALTVDDLPFRGHVESLYGELLALGPDVVRGGTNYYRNRDRSLLSGDRQATIIPLELAGEVRDADRNIGRILALVRAADRDARFQVLVTGDASVGNDVELLSQEDLRTGEALGIAVALLIALVVFGAAAAAVLPLILALIAIAVALGLTALVGQTLELSVFVVNMVVGMGFALGIDYSLFVLSRFREERRAGRAQSAAIAIAGATASRTVLFSGGVVVLALAGLLLVPDTVVRSLGLGAILVGGVAVLAALTLLPALLSLLGDRVEAFRLPSFRRAAAAGHEGGRGRAGVTRLVLRRPRMSLALAASLLVLATIPAFGLKTGLTGVSTLPDRLQSKQGFLALERDFSAGRAFPVEVVVDGRISPEVRQAIERLRGTLRRDASFGPASVEVNAPRDLTLVTLTLRGDPNGEQALAAVRKLRAETIPRAFAGTEAEVFVGGATAANIDYVDLTNRYRPIVFAFVLGLSFLLLTLAFRSLVVPAKAIALNLLSVGAAYGLMVLVFQHGFGAGLLGFQTSEAVDAWIPLFLFSVLFGLSMDYHVFLLTRVRERYQETGDASGAVAFGARSTSRLITGAALIMVAVFAGFAAGDLVMFQQMGFGRAVALLIDATIVRSVLVPAAMQLLGHHNWYLPRWLSWLPELERRQVSPAATARAVSRALRDTA